MGITSVTYFECILYIIMQVRINPRRMLPWRSLLLVGLVSH
jgi:hypothetical protein